MPSVVRCGVAKAISPRVESVSLDTLANLKREVMAASQGVRTEPVAVESRSLACSDASRE